MKVVVLCGGLGTRLREETEFKPKPMIEVGGRPLLWHILKLYRHHGFCDFVLCLGYKAETIKDYFLKYDALNSDFTIRLGMQEKIQCHGGETGQGFRVTLLDTGQETMTGGRVLRALPHITGDVFMVTYGDGLADVDIMALLKFHNAHGKLATVTTVRASSRYGMLDVTGAGEIRSFIEKPKIDGWISAGFFVFDRSVFNYLDGDSCVLEREPMERLARDGQMVAYRHEGVFYSMDTYREFLHLNELWANGSAPWRVWND